MSSRVGEQTSGDDGLRDVPDLGFVGEPRGTGAETGAGADLQQGGGGEERQQVDSEREAMRAFVAGLTTGDLKTGSWFSKLLAHALRSYTAKVDAEYFQKRYAGVPPDGIVEQRIRMAARYAAIEGALSASAYTGAVAATIGSLGGASPLTVSAAVTTLVIDLAYLTQLQIRLTYDIAVLYGVAIDPDDPDDLWKLIRVAFTIRAAEVAQEGALKIVPAMLRPLIVKYFSGSVRAAAQGLPVIGKYLLKRNLIKVGMPLVGVPLAAVVNRYSTLVVGRHARAVFRNEARIIEVAKQICASSRHPRSLLWVAWMVVLADAKVSEGEAFLFRRLVIEVRETHLVVDEQLADVIELDADDVWSRVDAEEGDLSDLLAAATRTAEIDGEINRAERKVIRELEDRISRRRGESAGSGDT